MFSRPSRFWRRLRALRYAVLASVMALSAGACMLSPRNGQVYADRDASITFQAYAPYEDAFIKFQAAHFDAGGAVDFWMEVGGCVADQGGFPDGAGTRHYYCTTGAPHLPLGAWTDVDVPPGYAYRGLVKALVRSQDGTRWYNAATFDYGGDTTNCILEAFGVDGLTVVTECSTGETTATIYAEVVPY